jgi:uncharacterized protein involved in exopolysaccharide biosynthesis
MTNFFDDKESSSDLINIYKKNKRLIFFTVLICTVLAAVASMLMEPRYKASASFFIPYNTSLENAIENPQFGFDIEADRLLQIINSNQLRDSIIKKFDLVNYYEIDTTKLTWRESLNLIYEQRINAGRTNIMSIYIIAETHDPLFSAKIVNYILETTHRFRERFFKTNSLLAVESFKADYLKKKQEVDSLKLKIVELRTESKNSPNIYISNNQILPSNSATTNSQQQIDLEIYTQRYIYDNNKLQSLMEKYENALNIYNRPIPKFYIIDSAIPVYKKTYPMVATNIVLGFLGSFLFIIVALYIKHIYLTLDKNNSV